MDNDTYPNDGAYFLPTEPEEQVEERRKSLSKAQAAKPMLEDLIVRITADIDRIKSVDAITVDPEADAESFMRAWYGVQQVKNYAEDLKIYLESLLATTKR
jgi:hypothetical protein